MANRRTRRRRRRRRRQRGGCGPSCGCKKTPNENQGPS